MANALEELIAEGIVRGRTEGRAEGQIEEKRAAVRLLLERRFGQVPDTLQQRIAAADKAVLDALFDRAITAPSIQDL